MMTGRRAAASSAAACSIAAAAGAGDAGTGTGDSSSPTALACACTSIGSISTTGLRSTSARRSARAASLAADPGACNRSATAPTDSTRSC